MIGELLAVACADPEVLARIGGRLGEKARDAAAELLIATVTERRTLRARVAAAARAPIPTGIRGVHASWIEAGLVGLPRRARTALASGATAGIDVWLVRWACSELPPLPAVSSGGSPGSIDAAIRLSGEALVAWLTEVGADQFAYALEAVGPDAVAEVAARVIGDHLHRAAARITIAPRAGNLGPTRAAIARCRGLDHRRVSDTLVGVGVVDELAMTHPRMQPGGDLVDDHLLLRVAARAIAPHVDSLARMQLAVRMPRPLGLVVHAELVAHASTPVDQCPTWPALAASC
jgi:hypothetical protein